MEDEYGKSIWKQEIKHKSDKLSSVNQQLRTYSGDIMKPMGKVKGELFYKDQCFRVLVIVADKKGPKLLGK